MAQSVFGVGFLFATPTGANPTPTRFGRLQDVSVDFSYDIKMLYGSYQFPLEQARGKGKIDLKATLGVVDPSLFNNIFFGLTTTTGQTLNSIDEAQTVPAPSGPYTVTVNNGGTFSQDLGIYNTVTGLWMTRVASGPATGQYSVNTTTGVYTFNSTQASAAVKISYTYAASGSGTSLAYTNQLMGSEPGFSVQLVNQFTGSDNISRSLFLNFPRVICPKLSMPLKLDDFLLPQLDMSAGDNGTGSVFNYSMTG
jgi:hypothetical protein